MITINVKEAFNKGVKEYLKLDVYDRIMKSYASVNLKEAAESADFRKMFNGYYNIRYDYKWQQEYYRIFEEMKSVSASGQLLSFEIILKLLRFVNAYDIILIRYK